jgi:hypothetical protein
VPQKERKKKGRKEGKKKGRKKERKEGKAGCSGTHLQPQHLGE